MRQLDIVQLAAVGAASKDENRQGINGVTVSIGAAIATDGHMLVKIEDHPSAPPSPDCEKVLADAMASATHFEVLVDPAKLAKLLRVLLEASGIAKAKKGAPAESMLQLKVRGSVNPLHPIVFEMELPDERKTQALLMPLRPEGHGL